MTSSDRLRLFRSTAKEKRVGKGGREGSEAEVASVSISRFLREWGLYLIKVVNETYGHFSCIDRREIGLDIGSNIPNVWDEPFRDVIFKVCNDCRHYIKKRKRWKERQKESTT